LEQVSRGGCEDFPRVIKVFWDFFFFSFFFFFQFLKLKKTNLFASYCSPQNKNTYEKRYGSIVNIFSAKDRGENITRANKLLVIKSARTDIVNGETLEREAARHAWPPGSFQYFFDQGLLSFHKAEGEVDHTIHAQLQQGVISVLVISALSTEPNVAKKILSKIHCIFFWPAD